MALSRKEKQKMADGMMVAGSIRAATELYNMAKPIVKKAIEKGKKTIKKIKEKKSKGYKVTNTKYKQGK